MTSHMNLAEAEVVLAAAQNRRRYQDVIWSLYELSTDISDRLRAGEVQAEVAGALGHRSAQNTELRRNITTVLERAGARMVLVHGRKFYKQLRRRAAMTVTPEQAHDERR